jgi:signal peptidase II
MNRLGHRLLPLSLTAVSIILDQLTKALVVKYIPEGYAQDTGAFIQFWHVRNPVIAFSLGSSLPDMIRPLVFIALPVLIIIFLCWYFLVSKQISGLQRWLVAGIIGGGIGNLIDRMFRPDGVVDFISINIPNITWPFRMERWPTFNIADSFVVVCVILFLITLFRPNKAYKA